MIEMTLESPSPTPAVPRPVISLESGVLVLLGVAVLGGLLGVGLVAVLGRGEWAVAVGCGWAAGGCSALMAWLVVALPMRLHPAGQMPVMAPIMATVVRLGVVIAGVAILLAASSLPPLPLIFTTLVAYLVLMATEAFLMYLTAPAFGERGPAPETTQR
ncbi:MAG: hypothetical protein RLN76_12275 [Phycisphaeraceae bacterium]